MPLADTEFAALSSLKSLRRLVLVGAPFQGCLTRHLESLPLRSLSLQRCLIVDDHLARLRHLRLSELALEGCKHVTAEGVGHLADMTTLRSLDLHGCLFHGRAVERLVGLPLTRLDLGCNPNISDCDVACLAGMTSLRTLVLLGTRAKRSALSPVFNGSGHRKWGKHRHECAHLASKLSSHA